MLGIARTFQPLCKTHTYLEQRTIRAFFFARVPYLLVICSASGEAALPAA
jgi:hypothetical protein